MRELAREIGSKKRLLLLLDYDGTLVPFKPGQARTQSRFMRGPCASSLNARGATSVPRGNAQARSQRPPPALSELLRRLSLRLARACVRAWSA